ncbi:ABC transporter substrate-binding protein [Bradyrhizobium sp. JYMT SZCCT0180]|uniref:ABC transporter substrate-binding protein n=1 Tax=Bradyrhizobium sp. JYMT SZCCT0180 TaxID=2807666 RepID=UPI001BA58A80|nr:ABC transporter substrate-binding protein [Bradyrhizobium sp. JYMT SZCCT0180]MBR1212939.1 ABC transporter substrate-binding protein [Bradyrhizobium sp. JYMT SZCCT0180]
MRRREFIAAIGSAAAWSLPALGQQAASRTLGVLDVGSLEGARRNFGSVQERLAEMGYVEGRNLALEYRCADSHEDRLGELARDLARHRVNAIAVFAGPSIMAAKAATTSIPIIFLTGFDPVASGFVVSLNRPGGNATGVSVLNVEVMAKRLQMLCELVPTAKSIGFFYNPTSLVSAYEDTLRRLELAADTLGVKLLRVETGGPDDFKEAFARMAGVRPDALLISADALMLRNRESLVGLTAQHRIPALYPIREFAADGGLVSYGPNYAEARRQVGAYLGRVLNGENPENLPVQQVTKFELVINMKTAKALGLGVPTSLLGRADEVIE